MLHSEPRWYATHAQQVLPWRITARPVRVLPKWDLLSLHALESRRMFVCDLELFPPGLGRVIAAKLWLGAGGETSIWSKTPGPNGKVWGSLSFRRPRPRRRVVPSKLPEIQFLEPEGQNFALIGGVRRPK